MDVRKEITASLEPRFFALWRRCLNGRGEADPAPVWKELVLRYSESTRHYHCIGHLQQCLEQLDPAVGEMDDPDAVEMAIWFHDAVFVVRSPYNERRSAELFRRLAAELFVPSFVEKVFRMILVTDHRHSPADGDEALVADIDLSSIALPWEHYLRDTLALRRESQGVPDERYYTGHRRFLSGLLERPRIFHSEFFYRHCEGDARRNIGRYLSELETNGRISGVA